MALCFLCNTKIEGERSRVCSSLTPHSSVPYPEKIVELLGEEFVIIVTPTDHMCKKCTALLNHLDKLENDTKLVKGALLAFIQKKYGLIPHNEPVTAIKAANGILKAEDEQKKLNNEMGSREIQIQQPIKWLKAKNSSKIYKCGFCAYQSKELNNVRFHMRTHPAKKTTEIPNTQTPVKPVAAAPVQQQEFKPPPAKKRLYRCQVCSLSFENKVNCLNHIFKEHNQNAATTQNEVKEPEVTISQFVLPAPQQMTTPATQENKAVINDINESQINNDDTSLETFLKWNPLPNLTKNKKVVQKYIPSQEIANNEKANETPIPNGNEKAASNLDVESMLAILHRDDVSKKNEGKKNDEDKTNDENKKNDEDKKDDEEKNEEEGKNGEGKKGEIKKVEGKKSEGKKGEGKKGEGKKNEGKKVEIKKEKSV